MYNSKELIMDKDLTFLSFNQNINEEFTVDEILNSLLWVVDNKSIFFDDAGVTGDHNVNWWNTQSSDISISTDTDGTTVQNNNTSGYSRDYAYNGSPLPSTWAERIKLMDSQYPISFIIEFTIVSTGNNNGIFLGNGNNMFTQYFSQIGAVDGSRIRIECDGSIVKSYCNKVLKSIGEYSIDSTSSFAFRVISQSSIKYRDLKIYDGNVVKAVPLFNCDKIVSSNSNDKVLDDNRCVILENSNDTLIQCISEDAGGIHYYNSVLYAYTPYCRLNGLNELVVYCIVYDKYLNTLNNVDVSVYVDDELNTIVKTNNEGVCEFKVDTVCTVKFKYEDTTSNEITIR